MASHRLRWSTTHTSSVPVHGRSRETLRASLLLAHSDTRPDHSAPAHILTKAALNSFIQRKSQAHYSRHVVAARHTLLLRESTLPTRLYLGIQENFEGRVDDFVTSSLHHGPQGSSDTAPRLICETTPLEERDRTADNTSSLLLGTTRSAYLSADA